MQLANVRSIGVFQYLWGAICPGLLYRVNLPPGLPLITKSSSRVAANKLCALPGYFASLDLLLGADPAVRG